MSDLDAQLCLLRRLPRTELLATLAVAIRASDDTERTIFLATLLEKCEVGNSRAAAFARRQLLTTWPALTPPQQKSALFAMGSSLPAILAAELTDADGAAGQALRAWTDIIVNKELTDAIGPVVHRGLAHPAALLDLVEAAATHATAESTDLALAARATISMLAAHYPSRQSLGLDPHAELLNQSVDTTLAHLAQTYDDHRDDAVIAATILKSASPGPAIRGWFSRRDDVGHMALRRVAKTLRPAMAAELATAWLGRPALAGLADRFLTSQGSVPVWTAALAQWPLLMVPSRWARVGKLRKLGEGMLNPGNWPDLPESARRGTIAWTATAHLREHDRRVRLCWHLGDPSPRVRHAAVRTLAARPASAELDVALADFAHDADARVAEAAISALGRARGVGRRRALNTHIVTARRSIHGRVRARARQLHPVFDPFAWPSTRAARWQAPVAAQAMLAREPEVIIEELRARLIDAGADGRRGGLWLVQRLGLIDDMLEELIAVALGVSGHVSAPERAKAMLLLGRVSEQHIDRAMATLAHGVSDQDGRIRADAVEAVGQLRGVDAALDGFMNDDVPRVRGNALRHGVIHGRAPAVLSELSSMLRDSRMPHRRTGLWVVERARPMELAGVIAELAQREPEPILRARSVRCARRLLTSLERVAA